jgi:hypothetical protein
MKIPVETKKPKMPAESIVMGQIAEVAWELEKEAPVKCGLKFKVPGSDELLEKTYAASMEDKSMLRKDVQTIIGRQFESDQEASDFELDSLKDRKIPVILMHRPGAGGKPTPAIGPIFSVNKLKDAVAALQN